VVFKTTNCRRDKRFIKIVACIKVANSAVEI